MHNHIFTFKDMSEKAFMEPMILNYKSIHTVE